MGVQITTHMRNSLKPDQSVCAQPDLTDQGLSNNIDNVDCVSCLRMLAKDAVVYGVDRIAQRWR